jgi:hypothetical protein
VHHAAFSRTAACSDSSASASSVRHSPERRFGDAQALRRRTDAAVPCRLHEREKVSDVVLPAGGLLHLDQALGGTLTSLRRSGHFRADAMETLLLDRPPATIHARSVLVIGLGDPEPDAVALALQALDRHLAPSTRATTTWPLRACAVYLRIDTASHQGPSLIPTSTRFLETDFGIGA